MCSNVESHPQPRGLALIEEWPERASISTTSLSRCKVVSFAECSSVRMYKCSSSYRQNDMSYSSADRRVFMADTAREASRIQSLVSVCSQNTSAGNAIEQLIRLKLLSKEELIGVESLVAPKKAARSLHRRKQHASAVLRAQYIMRKNNGMNVDVLAKIAADNSAPHLWEARMRAALAT